MVSVSVLGLILSMNIDNRDRATSLENCLAKLYSELKARALVILRELIKDAKGTQTYTQGK